MAKLYRHPEGGAFYDAFGGKIGEVEEVWVGDSFNRDTTYCNYISATNSGELNFTAKNCNIIPDAFDSPLYIAKGSVQEEESILRVDDVYFNTTSIKEKLCELQGQIDALKSACEAHNGIRAALKTLQYTREVE